MDQQGDGIVDQQRLEEEVDRNFEVFLSKFSELTRHHANEHMLMRDGQPVSFHPSAGAALTAGRFAFADGIFSVQEITDRPIDLGLLSHAVDPRIA